MNTSALPQMANEKDRVILPIVPPSQLASENSSARDSLNDGTDVPSPKKNRSTLFRGALLWSMPAFWPLAFVSSSPRQWCRCCANSCHNPRHRRVRIETDQHFRP
jgi:hypothetical protein